MTDRPIIHGYEIAGRMPPFTLENRKKIRNGSKTMTRRVIKLPPSRGSWEPTTVGGEGCYLDKVHHIAAPKRAAIWNTSTGYCLTCPYGLPGQYRAMTEPLVNLNGYAWYSDTPEIPVINWFTKEHLKWRWKGHVLSSLFMPMEAARTITQYGEIRAEQLQEITEEDAEREGVFPDGDMRWNPIQAFEYLWDSINAKKHPWESKPQVWVIPWQFCQ